MNDMRKFKNILMESYQEEPVMEDLGTLKFISPELISLFKHRKYTPDQQAKGLQRGLTSDSPVKTTIVGTATAMKEILTGREVFGAVFEIDGEQVFGVAVESGKYNTSEKKFNVDYTKTGSAISQGLLDSYDFKGTVSASKFQKIVTVFSKYAKEEGKRLEARIIEFDNTKGELRKSRADARHGSPFFSTNLIRDLKMDLKTRLETFKASKTASVDDMDAALETLTNDIMDMITVGGFSYKITNSRLHWDELRKPGDDSRSQSYLTYSLTGDSQDKRRALENEVYNSGKENFNEKMKELPPRSFVLHLKLSGNTLVPTRIKSSEY